MIRTSLFLLIFLLSGCDNSKWETIKSNEINIEPKSISNVIYFESENNGVVGGYKLIESENTETPFGLDFIPNLFLTENGGRNWKEITFNSNLRASVENAYLHGDTLICLLDTILLFSINKGNSFQEITDSVERSTSIDRYFKVNNYSIDNHEFLFKGKKYYIKERYQNDFAEVVVCHGDKTQTDYYFVSFDGGKKWTFLQESYGDNRARCLFEDKYLFCYYFPFGLQRLKLK